MKAYTFISNQNKPSDYLFQTSDGYWGRFLSVNNEVFPVYIDEYKEAEIASWDDILEIYQAPSNAEFFNDNYKYLAVKIWGDEDYTFIGISYESPNTSDISSAESWANRRSRSVKYYDSSISAEENSKIILKAEYYIAVPPQEHPYIIGMGLAKQIQNRMYSGKECYIVIGGAVRKIENIYLLRDGNPKKYAAVQV